MFRRSSVAPLAAVLVGLAAVSRPAAAQFGTNLIVNGNAEAGTGSASGDVVAVPGWTTTGNFTAVQYGASGGFPDVTSPGPANRGANFFGGGPGNASSSATQTVSLSGFAGLASLINGGFVSYTLSGYLGGFSSQGDNATLTAQFLSAGSALIGSTVLGPVSTADRNSETGLLFRTVGGGVPVGTQSIRFTIQMLRTDGDYNDGYADNLSLVLANGAPTTTPEPSTWALVAAGVLGVGGLARRRGMR